MIEQIDHVNIVVADLEKMTEFYREVLGFKVTKEVRISGEWIGEVVGLQSVVADVVYLGFAEGAAVGIDSVCDRRWGSGRRGIGESNAIGLRHLAFKVNTIDELVARLRLEGVKFFSEVRTVPTSQVQYGAAE